MMNSCISCFLYVTLTFDNRLINFLQELTKLAEENKKLHILSLGT